MAVAMPPSCCPGMPPKAGKPVYNVSLHAVRGHRCRSQIFLLCHVLSSQVLWDGGGDPNCVKHRAILLGQS